MLRETFYRDGFAVIPAVLSQDEVRRARATCAEVLTEDGAQELRASDFLGCQPLAEHLFTDRVLAAFAELLGADFRIYPNLMVRQSVYVPWHVDDAFTGPGADYVWEPAFSHVQAAIYLQDNDGHSTGGIDAVAGSHRYSHDGYGSGAANFQRASELVEAHRLGGRVESRAGDLVLWHARTLHKSSAASGADDGPTKYGLFISCGRNDEFANSSYLTHLIAKRVRRGPDGARVNPRFDELASARYPADYPDWLANRLAAAGTSIYTLAS